MSTSRKTRLVCLQCSVPLKADDHDHYGYQCHDCVVREHELTVVFRSDPDHPDVERLFSGPVDLGFARSGKG